MIVANMSYTHTLTITEARKKIFTITETVQTPGVSVILTEKGKPKAVLLSADEYEAWHETFAVAVEFSDIKKDAARARAEYKAGDYMTLGAYHKKHGLPRRTPKKRTKRS